MRRPLIVGENIRIRKIFAFGKYSHLKNIRIHSKHSTTFFFSNNTAISTWIVVIEAVKLCWCSHRNSTTTILFSQFLISRQMLLYIVVIIVFMIFYRFFICIQSRFISIVMINLHVRLFVVFFLIFIIIHDKRNEIILRFHEIAIENKFNVFYFIIFSLFSFRLTIVFICDFIFVFLLLTIFFVFTVCHILFVVFYSSFELFVERIKSFDIMMFCFINFLTRFRQVLSFLQAMTFFFNISFLFIRHNLIKLTIFRFFINSFSLRFFSTMIAFVTFSMNFISFNWDFNCLRKILRLFNSEIRFCCQIWSFFFEI